jgi:hypothetical protein
MHNSQKNPGDSGQILLLFALLCAALLFCVMLVIDVGFYMQERGITQNAADAAALAGSQELPGDRVTAEAVAVAYLEANASSTDPGDYDISFECTSDSDLVCTDATCTSGGACDTIVVRPINKAPNFFGGLMSLVGLGDTCWADGCDVDNVSAAGCRGACGPIGNAPVDVVEIIDRTGSMTSDDLAGAKTGALTFLENFNPSLQRVGLGVLGPSSTSSTCGSPNSGGKGVATSSGGTWLPVSMTSDFQNADGTVNNTSIIAKTINCMNTSSVGTNLGDPMKAAKDHLVSSGRPDVKWGIVMLTDGAANKAPTTTVLGPATDTGWHGCAANSAQSGQGDGNGFQSSASSACANDSNSAMDDDSGNNTNTTCTNTGKDKHRFWDFALDSDIDSGSTIYGIQVRLDAWAVGTGTKKMCVELSSNGGSSWTTAKEVALGGSQQTLTLGGAADLWGRTWSGSNFDSSNFRVRITNVSSVNTIDFRLDYLAVKVHYAGLQTVWDGSKGPCDYAVQQANLAKAAGIEIYMVGWGVDENCTADDTDSPYYNWNITDLMIKMATDANHVYDEPKTTDLEPIFKAIGAQLGGGSRLVR